MLWIYQDNENYFLGNWYNQFRSIISFLLLLIIMMENKNKLTSKQIFNNKFLIC